MSAEFAVFLPIIILVFLMVILEGVNQYYNNRS
jgi:hypothetical protein